MKVLLRKSSKRKNQYLAAKELADKLHIDTIDVLNMDDKRLGDDSHSQRGLYG